MDPQKPLIRSQKRLPALAPLLLVGALGAIGAALIPLRNAPPPELTVLPKSDGSYVFQVGAVGLEVAGRAGERGDVGTMRVDGIAPSISLSATLSGEKATLEIRDLRALAKKHRELLGDATIKAGDRTITGKISFAARKSPSGITLSYRGEREDDVGLVLSSRDVANLFVEGGAPLLEGNRDAKRVDLFGAKGGVSIASKHVVWGDHPHWFEARAGKQIDVLIGAGAAVSAGAERLAGLETRRVHGKTEPPISGAELCAIDDDGQAISGGITGEDGTFELAVPREARRILVRAGGETIALGELGMSPDLVIATKPMGRLSIDVRDFDREHELPARIVVHGIDGAREPNFGSPSRASGAGPVVDSESGHFATLMPAGRYRVIATRGLEYTVDQRDVEVSAGGETSVHLALRHALETPGFAACDLHVHSRGGFDSTVAIEDRVRSLMAAGIDFAAASEHNRTGSYESAIMPGISRYLSWVRAVEVTTVNPLRGHFNVLPFELEEVPPYRHSSLGKIIRFVREKSPESIIQVNHPRLGKGMGYFDDMHFDSASKQNLGEIARDFNTLEVYNGFDLPKRERVEQVLSDWLQLLETGRTYFATGDSDSHSIQYVTAGYPRTYAMVAHDHEDGAGDPLDVPGLIDGLKHGRAIATSGPFVEVTSGGSARGSAEMGMGDSIAWDETIPLHVRVRVAPWIDASEIEIYAGGVSALKIALPERALTWGEPSGTLDEAHRNTLVFERDLTIRPPQNARAIVVVVRGTRSLGQVLPFMDFQPMAIANPLLLHPR